MAAVWAGVNQRTGKRVALKVILRSLAAVDEAAELFRREALAASKVNHPNVVSIFDVVDHEAVTCIVMELLVGETLDAYLARNGPVGLQEAVALLLPAMQGVAAANAQGVVHRDLKPGNIFLCNGPDGRLVTTKVLDFGIARMMGRTGESSTALDILARLGTPAYMSPEAIQCSPDIDGRADVYGFGVLMFEVLTGQVPFPGQPGTELFARILTDPPPKLTEYRPDLPPEVVQIVDRALAKEAAERFPDMDHLIRAIEDKLLLPTQVPRTLTPMLGSFLTHFIESKSNDAIPTVGVDVKKEPSRPVGQSETKVLYSLAGQHGIDGASAVARKRPELRDTVNGARHLLTSITGLRRLRHWRAAISGGLVLVFTVTVWLTVAPRSNGHAVDKGHASPPSAPTLGPQVTPLPAKEMLQAPVDVVQKPLRGTPPIANAAMRTESPTPRIIARPSAHLPSQGVLRKDPVARRPRTTSPPHRFQAPRAGWLSPTDF